MNNYKTREINTPAVVVLVARLPPFFHPPCPKSYKIMKPYRIEAD